MGTSFVQYRGFGFWSRDTFLQTWIYSLLDEMKKNSSPESWENDFARHLGVQAETDGGVMSLRLDEFLIDQRRLDGLISVSRAAVHQTALDARRTGELFIDLLSGKLQTTASSPINYLD